MNGMRKMNQEKRDIEDEGDEIDEKVDSRNKAMLLVTKSCLWFVCSVENVGYCR